jgi:hypothetical protein
MAYLTDMFRFVFPLRRDQVGWALTCLTSFPRTAAALDALQQLGPQLRMPSGPDAPSVGPHGPDKRWHRPDVQGDYLRKAAHKNNMDWATQCIKSGVPADPTVPEHMVSGAHASHPHSMSQHADARP